VNVIIFGATGMIGQGVLQHCLAAPEVGSVLVVSRSEPDFTHPKLRTLVQPDLQQLGGVAGTFAGYDACFYCLGTSSAGMSQKKYRRINQELTLSVASLLKRTSAKMTFIYISGSGAGKNKRAMWARVKGEVEEALSQLSFQAAYMFRIGYVRAGRGIKSRSIGTRLGYALSWPFYPLLKLLFRDSMTTTANVGKAMIRVTQHGLSTSVMRNADINKAARAYDRAR
jgi:nucleoside-diphosphate-sugar epimerase